MLHSLSKVHKLIAPQIRGNIPSSPTMEFNIVYWLLLVTAMLINGYAISANAAEKVTICHKSNNTLSVSVNALQAHLNHGDTEGACENFDTDSENSDTDSVLTIEPTSHDFGPVNLGGSSAEQTFTLKNEDDSPLTLVIDEFANATTTFDESGNVVSVVDSEEFRITIDNCSNAVPNIETTLDSLANCDFTMVFEPQEPLGVKMLDLVIHFVDDFGSPGSLTLPLSAEAIASSASSGSPSCSGDLNQTCSNDNQVIDGGTIEENGNVSGGTIEGEVDSEGMVSQATIAEGAVLTGGLTSGIMINNGTIVDTTFVGILLEGGILAGETINDSSVGGIIRDVFLAANASITGGIVDIQVIGDATAPGLLRDVLVKAGTLLVHVIIGKGVIFEEGVVIGEGVSLASDFVAEVYTDIPLGIEAINLLPTIPMPDGIAGITYPPQFDFNSAIIPDGKSILELINELSRFTTNGWALSQNSKWGYFEVTIGNMRYAEIPLSLERTTADEFDMFILDAMSLSFVISNSLDVLTQPALQAPKALQAALDESFNLTEFTVEVNGNIYVPVTEGEWYSARPDWSSTILDGEPDMGLSLEISPYEGPFAQFIFVENGEYYQQNIFPSLAYPEDLAAVAEDISIEPYGLVTFTLDGETYRGVVDYLVSQDPETMEMEDTTETAEEDITEKDTAEEVENTLQVESIDDINGDEIDDIVLVYPNGDQQIVTVIE